MLMIKLQETGLMQILINLSIITIIIGNNQKKQYKPI